VQKEVVERVVLSACDHPTADTICMRAREEVPNLSLGTVYRILKGLVGEGKIAEVAIADAPSVFDKTVKPHGHLVCDKCGKVSDVFFDPEMLSESIEKGHGHSIDEVHVIFRGTCADCLEKAAAKQ